MVACQTQQSTSTCTIVGQMMSFIPEAIFLESLLILHSQVRFLSMCTPIVRSLQSRRALSENLFIVVVGFAIEFNILCLEPISRDPEYHKPVILKEE